MSDKPESNGSLFNIPLNSESGSASDTDCGLASSQTTTLYSTSCNSATNSDGDHQDETADKVRLICQVLELQNTLEDLSQRVDSVKEENMKLKSENEVLGRYIENLMASSSVFQNANPKSKKK